MVCTSLNAPTIIKKDVKNHAVKINSPVAQTVEYSSLEPMSA